MKKLLLLLSILVSGFGAYQSNGQCNGSRYADFIFPSFTKTTVEYSSVYHLNMDIYQPTGDTLSARPLIILAHGGSFISGARDQDSTVYWMCSNFAKRGYVTVSIDYRLASSLLVMYDSAQAIDEVVKAVSDGKAAVRYFKMPANISTYKIDTNNIYIGGNSAGAVLYMHVGYLDSLSECNADVADAMAANGGFEGNSGNAGYSSKAKAVIDLAGGLNSTSFVGMNDIPSVNAQGDADQVVPYTCNHPVIGLPVPVTLCGLGSLEAVYTANRVYHMSKVFPGRGHVPWASDPAVYTTVDSLVKVFLYYMVCSSGLETPGIASTLNELSIYPNPSFGNLNFSSGISINKIEIYDYSGKRVMQFSNIGKSQIDIDMSDYNSGIYLAKVTYDDPQKNTDIRKVIIK